MAKRGAAKQMTHENWEEEEEEEEELKPMKMADPSIIAKRQIKKAKRRTNLSQGSNASPFSAFTGFGSKGTESMTDTGFKLPSSGGFGFGTSTPKPVNQSQPTSSGFSFGSSSTNNPPQFNFGTTKTQADPSDNATTQSKATELFKSSVASSSNSTGLFFKTNASQENSNGSGKTNGSLGSKALEQYAKDLSTLNKSVCAWITQHIDMNSVCDLTPVFEDYKTHIQKIEKTFNEAKNETSVSNITSTVKGPVTDNNEGVSKPAFGGFNFGSTANKQEKSEASKAFQFGSGAFGSTSSTQKPFGAAGGFTFKGVTQPEKKEEETTADEEHEEAPKVEFKQVEEKDAIYSQRAKIFYKSDNAYKERGVGMLYIKETDGSGQILVRADTSLGNVILNIGIPKGLPISRQGKNNVLLMTPLNPPADPKCNKCNEKYLNPQESTACPTPGCIPDATAILIRVKTKEDADKLHEEIKKLS